jgi:hypothetical protein
METPCARRHGGRPRGALDRRRPRLLSRRRPARLRRRTHTCRPPAARPSTRPPRRVAPPRQTRRTTRGTNPTRRARGRTAIGSTRPRRRTSHHDELSRRHWPRRDSHAIGNAADHIHQTHDRLDRVRHAETDAVARLAELDAHHTNVSGRSTPPHTNGRSSGAISPSSTPASNGPGPNASSPPSTDRHPGRSNCSAEFTPVPRPGRSGATPPTGSRPTSTVTVATNGLGVRRATTSPTRPNYAPSHTSTSNSTLPLRTSTSGLAWLNRHETYETDS